jgi:hypothetical protein
MLTFLDPIWLCWQNSSTYPTWSILTPIFPSIVEAASVTSEVSILISQV